MASSPELGQPKAPDKVDLKLNNFDVSIESGIYRDKATQQNSSTSATQQDSENLGSWDDGKLKALLDEAITYKTPRDRENKSKIFKELLHNVETEDQEPDFSFYRTTSRTQRGTNRHHTQGGSLQDLAETDTHDLDDDFYHVGNTKKHNHLRSNKYSSVSSRQREGGSLPTNVNVTTCFLCPYEQPFLNEVNKRTNNNIINNNNNNNKKNDRTISLSSAITNQDIIKDESLIDGKLDHTVIDIDDIDSEETQHLLAHDSLAQSINEPLCGEDGSELNSLKKIPRVPVNFTSHAKLEISFGEPSSSRNNIDNINNKNNDSYTLIDNNCNNNINNNNKNVDNTPLQLNASYSSVKSIVDTKTDMLRSVPVIMSNSTLQNAKYVATTNLAPILTQKLLDENGNSVQSFNSSIPASSQQQTSKIKTKKTSKSERNTVIVDYSKKEGFRGTDAIESLVRYIEKSETNKTSNNNKNGNIIKVGGGGGTNKNNNNILSNDKTNNNNNKKNKTTKKDNGKLKKCNSLEELSSCSKLKEISDNNQIQSTATTNNIQSQENEVILRSKPIITATIPSSSINTNVTATTTASKKITDQNRNQKAQQKRTERRSWGTEELSYLGETKIIVTNSKDDDDNNLQRKDDDKHVKKELVMKDKEMNSLITRKKDEQLLSVISIESIPTGNETAEFLLVTKKKKTKKRNLFNEHDHRNNKTSNTTNYNRVQNNNSSSSNNQNSNNHNNSTNQRTKYQSSNFTNDRDIYLNSFNTNNDNRRKSTSSVPPSEHSDSSDVDSVHSLPIETTTTTLLSSSSGGSSSSSSGSSTTQSARHSLQKQQTKVSGGTPQASYADIAKIANNIEKLTNNNSNNAFDKWPTVNKNSNDSSPDSSSTTSNKSQSSTKTIKSNDYDVLQQPHTQQPTINNYDHNDITFGTITKQQQQQQQQPQQLSYSQSLSEDKLITTIPNHHNHNMDSRKSHYKQTTINTNTNDGHTINNHQQINSNNNNKTLLNNDGFSKNLLKKSKSVEHDNYTVSNDHYPALEKTIKKYNPNDIKCNKQIVKLTAVQQPIIVKTIDVITTISTGIPSTVNSLTVIPSSILPSSSTILSSSTTSNITKKQLKQLQSCILDTQTGVLGTTNTPPTIITTTTTVDTTINSTPKKSHFNDNELTAILQKTNDINNPDIVNNKQIIIKQRNLNNNNNKKDNINNNRNNLLNSNNNNLNNNINIKRPAVIILNDNDKTINDITFGFEINKSLLFEDDDNLINNDNSNCILTTPVTTETTQIATTLYDNDNNNEQTQYNNNIKNLTINNINNSDISTISDSDYITSSVNNSDCLSDSFDNNNIILSDGICVDGQISQTSKRKLTNEFGDKQHLQQPQKSSLITTITTVTSTISTIPVVTTASSSSSSSLSSSKTSSSSLSSDIIVINDININNNRINCNNFNNNNKDIKELSITSTAAATTATSKTTTTTNTLTTTVNKKKNLNKELNIHYMAPTVVDTVLSEDHDKIVAFIGRAWEDIMAESNGGTKYYNEQ